jgi:hypothetical protein
MTLRILVPPLALLALAACETMDRQTPAEPPPTAQAPTEAPVPEARPADQAAPPAEAPAVLAPPETVTASAIPPAPPPAGANTAETLDTTTPEERAAAAAPPAQAASAGRLGTTVASLGPPAEAGIWLKTPLVTEVTRGRVEDPATGQIINVELRPSGGEPGSGSQISIAAMRLLNLPLTSLPELVVYRG